MPKPNRAAWEDGFSAGHALIDDQHQGLLLQCHRLADLSEAADDATRDQAFDQAFVRLQELVREHFEAEASLLASLGWTGLEDHRFECDEFEYLVSEIVSVEHFDRLELQRFLALWCVGHIVGSAHTVRTCLAGQVAPD